MNDKNEPTLLVPSLGTTKSEKPPLGAVPYFGTYTGRLDRPPEGGVGKLLGPRLVGGVTGFPSDLAKITCRSLFSNELNSCFETNLSW